jgi:hypothetical protein
MGRARGVKRDAVVRMPLSDGDWVDLRVAITAGERRDVPSEATISVGGPAGRVYHHRKLSLGIVGQYVAAWSLTDVETGLPIFWSVGLTLAQKIEILGRLDEATVEELEQALSTHLETQKNGSSATTTAPMSEGS